MLLLAALAAAPTLQVKATVRIERAVKASGQEWEKLPATSKREVIVRDEQGRPVLLRLVENQ